METSETAPKRGMRPWVKWSLIGVSAVLITALTVTGVYVFNLWSAFNSQVGTIPDPFGPDDERPDPLAGAAAGAQTILLLGSDTRGALDDPDDPGGRSDTIMVVHIPADHEDIVVMSIMRDNWIEIPGHGEHKINAALLRGGVPLVVKTVEKFLDTRIDHVAVIDFEGFKGLSSALGGVTVDNPRTFRARTGDRFPAGQITLEGDAALAFVRERMSFPDGDYTRVKNQQLFIKGVLNALLSAETLTNPGRISDVVNSIAPYLQVDSGLNMAYLLGLAFDLRDVRAADVTFFTTPTLGTGNVRGQSIVRVDWAGIERLRTAFRESTLIDYAASLAK